MVEMDVPRIVEKLRQSFHPVVDKFAEKKFKGTALLYSKLNFGE